MKHLITIFLMVSSLSLYAQIQTKRSYTGRVVGVVDGDTYDILINGLQCRIRMQGIDAPERGMPYGTASKNYLSRLIFNKTVRVYINKKDGKRWVAETYLPSGNEAGAELVAAGMAWHFKKYSNSSNLSLLEQKARKQKIGLWADANPQAPWDYRQQRRRPKR